MVRRESSVAWAVSAGSRSWKCAAGSLLSERLPAVVSTKSSRCSGLWIAEDPQTAVTVARSAAARFDPPLLPRLLPCAIRTDEHRSSMTGAQLCTTWGFLHIPPGWCIKRNQVAFYPTSRATLVHTCNSVLTGGVHSRCREIAAPSSPVVLVPLRRPRPFVA